MITRESEKHLLSTMRRKVLLIILIILISIEIILFIFIKLEKIKELDIEITTNIQNDYINEKTKTVPILLDIVHFVNDIYFPYILISIVYNFYTVYDCFILVNILSINYIFSFIFKLIYFKPSYKYYDERATNFKIFYCGYGWGFPSEECITTISFYLSIWKIVTKLSFKFSYKKIVAKFTGLFFICLIFFGYNFCNLLIGYYCLSHIIFSAVFGLIIYLIFFESNFFNLFNGNEFINFIKKYNLIYIIINLSLFVIFTVVYMILRLTYSDDNKYNICETVDGIEHFKKSGKFSYLDGTFCFNILFLGNVFAIFGIIADLKVIYKNDDAIYYQINFPQDFEDMNNSKVESFSGSIHITKEVEWNNTPVCISLLRLLLVLVFCWVCFFPYIFLNLTDSYIILILIIKILLPPSLFFMGIFFYLKPLLECLKLTNVTLNSISEDI